MKGAKNYLQFLYFLILFTAVIFSGYCDIQNSMELTLGNSFYYQHLRTDNQLNLENWLEFVDWNDISEFSFYLLVDLNGIVSFHFSPEVEFFKFNSSLPDEYIIDVFQPDNFQEYTELIINRMSLSFVLFSGYLALEIGKLLPAFGVGYGWRPTDFITLATKNRTINKSKFLIDLNFFYDFLNFEVIYAPNRDFIPDDYADLETIIENDDFWLVRCGMSLSFNELSIIYFHGNEESVGINLSSQIGDELIPYCEVVVSNDSRIKRLEKDDSEVYNFEFKDDLFFTSLAGLCYSPSSIDFSFYFEFLYNGDGFTPDEWHDYYDYIHEINDLPVYMTAEKMGYLGSANTNFLLTRMSNLYFFLHLKSNDYLGNFFSIADTIIMTYPVGLLNNLSISFNFLNDLYFDIDFFSILYADKYSEYSYFSYDTKLDFNLYYKVSF